MTDTDDFQQFEIEVTPAVAGQITAAAGLTGDTPEEFIETAVLARLQALDNLLHGDAHIDLPPGFNAEAWRERHEQIRDLETPRGYDGI